MCILPDTAIIRAKQFYANQADVVSTEVNEVAGCLILRLSRKLVVIHFSLVLPVHSEDVGAPHKLLTTQFTGRDGKRSAAVDAPVQLEVGRQ